MRIKIKIVIYRLYFIASEKPVLKVVFSLFKLHAITPSFPLEQGFSNLFNKCTPGVQTWGARRGGTGKVGGVWLDVEWGLRRGTEGHRVGGGRGGGYV